MQNYDKNQNQARKLIFILIK